MENFSKLAACDDVAQAAQRGPEAAIMPDGEYEAGGVAGGEHGLRVVAAERQRLLAKHLLAGSGGGDHLVLVQGMRRREQDRVDVRVLEHGGEIVGERYHALAAEIAGALEIGLDRVRDPEPWHVACGFDERAAPAAEACDGAIDHLPLPDFAKWFRLRVV